jgi:maltooligosyltrehalose trehalohydrolase
MRGERLCHLVDWERAKLAAAGVLLSPFTPLLFMGEEYAEPAPFLYHVSHSDPKLQRAVREGRRAEFRHFFGAEEPPDPQDAGSFVRSKLSQTLAREGCHAIMHDLYRELICIRKSHPAICPEAPGSWSVSHYGESVLEYRLMRDSCSIRVILNFGERSFRHESLELEQQLLNTADLRWACESSRTSAAPEPTVVQPLSCIVSGSCKHGGPIG